MKKQKNKGCDSTPVLLDCRIITCKFYENGLCNHINPALVLNNNRSFDCLSERDKKSDAEKLKNLRKKAKKLFSKADILCEGIKTKRGKLEIEKVFRKSEKITEEADELELKIKQIKKNATNKNK